MNRFSNGQVRKLFVCLFICLGFSLSVAAQNKLRAIEATSSKASLTDGENVRIDWKLDPELKPDIYYVNVPRKRSVVRFTTDKGAISFNTKYGETHEFVVLLNAKDRCLIRIVAKEEPTALSIHVDKLLPQTIPFTLVGSRIYFQGKLNNKNDVAIQLDLGAGTATVNKNSTARMNISFTSKTSVSNTQGINDLPTSVDNELSIGGFSWKGVALTEVGNMQPHEDLIIGNAFFQDKIVEIDYDKKLLTIHDKLPVSAKTFTKQPVYFEQTRPKFKADFVQDGKKYSFWFLFDTGRDGTMLIGEDLTGQAENWQSLKELQLIKGRKIVRLNAAIAGVEFKDIVTNAADPAKPGNRPSLFGNQILNHFNVILDNQKGFIYLKPNSRTNEPYSDYANYLKETSNQKQ